MNPRSSKLRAEELKMIDDEVKVVLTLIKTNALVISNGLAPLTEKDLNAIDVDQSLDANDPHVILKGVRNLLDELRKGGIQSNLNQEELAYSIGHTVAKYATSFLEWQMKFLKCDFMPDGEVAVISNDNKYVLYPSMFVYRFLDDPAINNTIMLSLNMCKDQGFPPSEKNFEVIMG